jgi:putative transposase
VKDFARNSIAVRGPVVSVQIPLPMLASLQSAREDLFALFVDTGRQVLGAMMEQDRVALCGPKGKRLPERSAVRAGSTASEVTLGGQRVSVRRLRARGIAGGEVALPSFAFAADRDPLNRRTWLAIARGVSSRGYRDVVDPLPAGEVGRAISKSAVSRRFVALSVEHLRELLTRPLGDLDIRAVLIDGIVFHEHAILIALGVAKDGKKDVLALREGASENTAVAKALIEDLVERGLSTERAVLFVIDGSKALRRAIRDVFGSLGIVQRCQVHKQRNVLEHLPENVRPRVRSVLTAAWDMPDAALAERRLRALAGSLEREHPGAASSLLEGLAETLTLQKLGVRGALYRTLRSTNAIENLNGAIARFTRNVKHWQGGEMLLRWVGAAVVHASLGFRRLRGYADLRTLVTALDCHIKHNNLDRQEKAA